jgi:hypothetical protein
VLLALGTEDQVQLLEVTRGLKEAVFTHSSQDFQERMQATCDDSHSIQTASVGEPVSSETCPVMKRHETFSHSVVNYHEPVFLGQSDSQTRHIRNSLSEVPQSLYDHTGALESWQSYCYHNSDSVPTLDAQEDVRSLSVDVSDLTGSLPSVTSVLQRTKHQEGKIDGMEFQGNSCVNVARHMSFKNGHTGESNAKKPCSFVNEGSAVSFECQTIRREKHTQEPNFQFATGMVIARNFNVDSLGTKEFSQPVVDQQIKPPQHDKSSQAGAGLQTHGIIGSKIDSCLLSDKQANIGISSKHQESQTDLHVIDLTSSETVTLQDTPRTTKGATCELPRSPLGDVICEACISSNGVSNVQPEDFCDSKNSSFSENEHIKESVRDKKLSCQSTQTSLSQVFAELNIGVESCTGPGIQEPCSKSLRPDLNADSYLGIVNQASNTQQSSSLPHESSTKQPAEVDPKCSFYAHIEIERAMHLQCFMEHNNNETVSGTAFEPSTYVTFVLKQDCPATIESELKVGTPLAPHTASPVWNWQCDTWLPSDLLTNVSILAMKFYIFQKLF